MLAAARAGRSALLVAATGAGKTLAGFLPTICDLVENPAEGLHTLYISPLKALAVDVQRNLLTPIEEMGLPIRVETRTGDTPSDRKARQRVRPPQILLTTPESPEPAAVLSRQRRCCSTSLKTVVIDEIHAFAREKRGDLLSLSLARLQALAPSHAPRRPLGHRRRSRRLSRLAGARTATRNWSSSSSAIPAPTPTSRSSFPRARCHGAGTAAATPRARSWT